MKTVLDALLGAVLAAAIWAALQLSQNAWRGATTRLFDDADPAVTVAALLVTGAAIGVLARVMPATSLWVAAGLLVAALAPVAFGLGSWWPAAFPGSALQLGVHAGTYITLGFLLAAAGGRTWSRRRATRTGAGGRLSTPG